MSSRTPSDPAAIGSFIIDGSKLSKSTFANNATSFVALLGTPSAELSLQLGAGASAAITVQPKNDINLIDIWANGLTTPLVGETIQIISVDTADAETVIATLTFLGAIANEVVRLGGAGSVWNDLTAATIAGLTASTRLRVKSGATGVTGGYTIYMKFNNV